MSLDDVKKVCAEASPGPWLNKADDRQETAVVYSDDKSGIIATCHSKRGRAYRIADARFISLARAALPAYVAEIEMLRDENERLRTVLEVARRFVPEPPVIQWERRELDLKRAFDALEEP